MNRRFKKDHLKQRGRTAPNKKKPYTNSTISWAENEVKLACKRENPNWDGKSFDYGIACYQSALKAFKSLANDEHSGMSWGFTMNILERLMRLEPLTPITDEDFFITNNSIAQSEDYLKEVGLKSSIQCPRMSSLFRNEHLDGTITYTDVDRYFCYDELDANNTYSGGGGGQIIDEFFPITMPYYPPKNRYQLCCSTFSVDAELGDYDTKGYLYVITPESDIVHINRFYKEVKVGEPVTKTLDLEHFVPDDNGKLVKVIDTREYTHQPTEWVEISKEEFEERKKNKIDNIDKEESQTIS